MTCPARGGSRGHPFLALTAPRSLRRWGIPHRRLHPSLQGTDPSAPGSPWSPAWPRGCGPGSSYRGCSSAETALTADGTNGSSILSRRATQLSSAGPLRAPAGTVRPMGRRSGMDVTGQRGVVDSERPDQKVTVSWAQREALPATGRTVRARALRGPQRSREDTRESLHQVACKGSSDHGLQRPVKGRGRPRTAAAVALGPRTPRGAAPAWTQRRTPA